MDPNSDFMASSHFSESGLIIASSKFVGSLSSTNKTVKTGLPYHSGGARDHVDLRRSVVASSEASGSLSLASSIVGAGGTGTISGAALLSKSREGSTTSYSSTFLPLTSFERNSFSRKEPFFATNTLPSVL